LTESQFKEAWAISGILEGEIQKSGSFRAKLTDYAHAFARDEKFDATRSEAALRDVYKGRTGESMNQTREALLEREQSLPPEAQARIEAHTEQVLPLIQEGQTQPFYKAYDAASVALSRELGVTQDFAKEQMTAAFQSRHGRTLYEAGKEAEEAYHKPVREAEIAARKQEQLESRSLSRSRD